jgi:hypothetical protein
MTADILTGIDGALEDWATAQSAADAMHWSPHPFPPLPAQQQATVRQVAHDTGLDGYAAWLVVADVMEYGAESRYAEYVWPHIYDGWAWREPSGRPRGGVVPADAADAVFASLRDRVHITVDTASFTRALEQAGAALQRFGATMVSVAEACGATVGKMVTVLAPVAHAVDADRNPREHIRCHRCHPQANPKPLPINGHEYHRRQRARRRASKLR